MKFQWDSWSTFVWLLHCLQTRLTLQVTWEVPTCLWVVQDLKCGCLTIRRNLMGLEFRLSFCPRLKAGCVKLGRGTKISDKPGQTLPFPVHLNFPWTLHISCPFKTSKWERTLTKLFDLCKTETWLYKRGGGDPLIIKWSLVLWRVHLALNMPCDWYLDCSYYLNEQQRALESEGTACNSVKRGRPGSRHMAVGLKTGFPEADERGLWC